MCDMYYIVEPLNTNTKILKYVKHDLNLQQKLTPHFQAPMHL